MSATPGSTPNFLPSLIFTFSSINSLITSLRSGVLWVVRKLSLLRCSMSKSVIGSPLTMTATVCACSGETPSDNNSAAAQLMMRVSRRCESLAVMIIFAGRSIVVEASKSYRICSSSRAVLLDAGTAGRRGRVGECAQADLEHVGMAEHGRRRARRIAVGCHIVCRQHEAIIHVAGTDDILVELVGFQIPTCRAGRDPVRRDLDRPVGEQA